MIDDTKESIPSTHSADFTAELIAITNCRTNRFRSRKWVRNLRFLAFDDREAERSQQPHVLPDPAEPPGGGTAPNTERESCADCVFRVEGSAAAENCEHARERSCVDCGRCPPFPLEGGPCQHFRIVQFREPGGVAAELSPCDHYVAVSYCWSSTTNSGENPALPHEGPYTVRELDGSTRPNRAPAEVIDRAVAFAAQNSIRLIWIDQECIEQDDIVDKEVGIQSMDLVYQKACFSIGILSASVDSQAQINALVALDTWGRNATSLAKFPSDPSASTPYEFALNLTEMLELVANDRWFTRAWILQESFSAGRAMCILIKYSAKVDVSGTRGLARRCTSSTELVIDLDRLISCFAYAEAFYGLCVRSPLFGDFSECHAERLTTLMRRLRWLHPISKDVLENSQNSMLDRPRKTCNAAVALSFLRYRFHTRIQDRLAIIANLCNYDVRLDTVEVEKRHQNLSICIFALAVLNGDMSLLYPEVYGGPGILRNTNHSTGGLSWLPLLREILPLIKVRILDPARRAPPRSLSHSKLSHRGLSLPACLWKVNNKAELRGIQARFARRWLSMKCARLRYMELEDTGFRHSFSGAKLFQDLTTQFERFTAEILLLVMRQLTERGIPELADAIWHSIRREEWHKTGPEERWLDSDPHSLPDSARDFQVLPAEAWKMMQLHDSGDGSYRQAWLVERIMTDGHFWFGRLVDTSKDVVIPESKSDTWKQAGVDTEENVTEDKNGIEHAECPAHHLLNRDERNECETCCAPIPIDMETESRKEGEVKEVNESHESSITCPRCTHRNENRRRSCEVCGRSLAAPLPLAARERPPATLATSQLASSIIAARLMSVLQNKDEDIIDDTDTSRNIASYIMLAQLIEQSEQDERDKEAGIQRQPRLGIFDAVEPCLVITPYDAQQERLPPPEVRAMSMSWVVEPVEPRERDPDLDWREETLETFRTLKMVKGLWKFISVLPRTRYTLV